MFEELKNDPLFPEKILRILSDNVDELQRYLFPFNIRERYAKTGFAKVTIFRRIRASDEDAEDSEPSVESELLKKCTEIRPTISCLVAFLSSASSRYSTFCLANALGVVKPQQLYDTSNVRNLLYLCSISIVLSKYLDIMLKYCESDTEAKTSIERLKEMNTAFEQLLIIKLPQGFKYRERILRESIVIVNTMIVNEKSLCASNVIDAPAYLHYYFARLDEKMPALQVLSVEDERPSAPRRRSVTY